MSIKLRWSAVILTALVAAATAWWLVTYQVQTQQIDMTNAPTTAVNPIYAFGFNTDSFYIDTFQLETDQFLGSLLADHGVPYGVINDLARAAKDVFSVRQLQPGKRCAFVKPAGTGMIDCFVYEPSPYRYVKFFLTDTPSVVVHERPVETCLQVSGGVIESSLWLTMTELGQPVDLIVSMENALAWAVDFHHIDPGDAYKLLYNYDYIDGVPVGVSSLEGAVFTSGSDTTYSIYFESGKYSGYFDMEGRPMKRAFLRAPVRYSQVRISSRYSSRRFHPVLKRYRGHFGTDYAAPIGTPIIAVADGQVTAKGFTNGNGNFVKIRHDGTYETQYLHMSRFRSGVNKGTRVKQGDVIGYVGQTGLATGPHVCFRFWKNGKQVDHLRENLPPPDPMPKDQLPEFFEVRAAVSKQLDQLKIREVESQVQTSSG